MWRKAKKEFRIQNGIEELDLRKVSQHKLLELIAQETLNVHFHLDRMEAFYKMVHGIKEDEKTGAWLEDRKGKQDDKG